MVEKYVSLRTLRHKVDLREFKGLSKKQIKKIILEKYNCTLQTATKLLKENYMKKFIDSIDIQEDITIVGVCSASEEDCEDFEFKTKEVMKKLLEEGYIYEYNLTDSEVFVDVEYGRHSSDHEGNHIEPIEGKDWIDYYTFISEMDQDNLLEVLKIK